jgi:two-component system OmpR family sensor kinase
MPKSDKCVLKIIYDGKKFKTDINALKYKILKVSLVILLLMLLFSLYFAMYSLKPIKNAISLLEVFLKDLIHDLNTPVTSILLNSKLLSKKEPSLELERIELSAKSISFLYKNLEILKNKVSRKISKINIKEIIEQRVKILQKLYPNIKIQLNLEEMVLNTNEDAIGRILDNILTNACKYNKKNGKVIISTKQNQITIEDTGIGIKNIKRVFEQYYKENERGLGLGMNIVKRLCDELKIKIKIKSKINIGTTIELTLN